MMSVIRTIALIFVYLLITSPTKATEVEPIKDLLKTLATTNSDNVKIHTQVKIANHYIYHNLDSAIHYIDLVLENPTTKEVLPKDFYLHLLIKAWTHQGNGELMDAKEYMQQANTIVSKHGNRKATIEIRLNLASILVDLKDKEAIDFIDEYLVFLDTTSQNGDDQVSWLLAKQLKARSLSDRGDIKSALEEMVELNKVSFLDGFPDKKFGVLKEISLYLKQIGNMELSE